MTFSRYLSALLSLILVAVVSGGAAVAKQDITVELFYNGIWNDHTADVYSRDDISIVHSAQNEQRGPVPSEASLTFQGRDGRMNPANPKGELFGLIGRQTPIRITAGTDVRFSGKIRSWKPRRSTENVDLAKGRGDAWVYVKAAGVLGNLGTDPFRSPLHRSISGIAPGDYVPWAYWPMEDGRDSTQFGADTAGLSPMTFSGGITLAADEELLGSQPLPTFDSTGTAIALIPAYTDMNQAVLQVALKVNTEPGANTTYLEMDTPGGDNALWRLWIEPGATTYVHWWGYNSAGVATGSGSSLSLDVANNPTEADYFGNWWFYTLSIYKLVGLIFGKIAVSDGRTQEYNYGSAGSATVGAAATTIRVYGGNGISVGHLGFFADPSFDIDADSFDNAAAMNGWSGETAGARFERLCREEDITSTVVGTAADTQPMGPQRPETMLAQLREIATTDNGMIFDTRTAYGLTMRTGRSLYNQS